MCPIENAQALLNNFCGLAVHANSGQGRNGRGGLGGRSSGAAPEDPLETLKPQPPGLWEAPVDNAVETSHSNCQAMMALRDDSNLALLSWISFLNSVNPMRFHWNPTMSIGSVMNLAVLRHAYSPCAST